MNKREGIILTVCLVLLDALAFTGALVLAYYLRIGSGLLSYNWPHQVSSYVRTVAVAVPVFLAICANARLYDPQELLGGPEEYAHVIRACTFGVVALMALSFWDRGDLLSRGWLLMSWILSIVLLGAARFVFRRVIYFLRRRDLFVTTALIVGANEQAKAIARQLEGSRGRGVRIVGFLDDYLPPGTPVLDDLEVLGSPIELERMTRDTGAGVVVVVPDALAWESFQEIIRKAASRQNGLQIKLSPGFYEILTTGVKVDHTTFVPLLTVERVRITGVDALLKNLLDYGLGLVVLVFLAPVMAVISLFLRLGQGRPILDRHPVLGLGGRPFLTLKFRTGLMGSARRSLVDPLPARLAGSGHTTRLGIFLFSTGLDKLPQIFNVLQGHMSLVGPRTISDVSFDQYGPWLSSMLTVKPGVTGPWAVRSAPVLNDEIRLTMYYIRNWTIWFDLQVLFQTAMRILRRPGVRAVGGKPGTATELRQEGGVAHPGILETRGEKWT